MQNLFNGSIFNFCLLEDCDCACWGRKINFGKYCFCADERTPIEKKEENGRELLIFGMAVSVFSGESKGLCQKMLSDTNSLAEIIEYEKHLGGKYILFYREGDECYAIPDATASIPFCFHIGEVLVCSSVSEYVASKCNLKEDAVLRKIRNSSEISQAMPYDLTLYSEVRQLLPNHYFSFTAKKTVRFLNSAVSQKEITADEACQITLPYIEKILRCYSSEYKLYCPITGGRDSRAVLAFLCDEFSEKDFLCYTIKHNNFSNDEEDLVISNSICEKMRLNYKQMLDLKPDDNLVKRMDLIFGENKYSPRTLTIANTVFNLCKDGAILNGDTIGQVGKCSLHRDIPSFLATAGYFMTKLHNYSKEAKKTLKDWLREIKSSGEKVNTFDLFSVESRMGRWAAQENVIYNSIGQIYLNIFNSRSIIYEWTRVPRKERKNSAIHLKLIDKKCKQLLLYPFESDSSVLVSLSKANGIFYYAASRLKHFVNKLMFNKK